MKVWQGLVLAAPMIVAVCSAVQDKVPAKYSIFVVAVMAAAMYLMRAPKDDPK